MIIDVHAHIGHWGEGYLSPDDLTSLMDAASIDMALISCLDGMGKDTDQAEANRQTRQAVVACPHRLRGLVWVNPWLGERALDNARNCLHSKREFVGLKFHPFFNCFYFDSPLVAPFIQMAKEHGVPIAVHTAYDEYSHPNRVAAAAKDKEYADVKFILYHAGLAPPDAESGSEALQLVASQPNLYMDISWLSLDRLRQALDIVPIERVLFGTDLPLGGEQHYREYFEKLEELRLERDQWAKLREMNR